MIKHTVDAEVTTKHPRDDDKRLCLPAGWTIHVPEIEPQTEDNLFQQYVEYELRSRRFRAEAQTAARRTLQKFWTRKWVAAVKEDVRYYMRKYASRYPSNVAENGELFGFEPAEVALWFYPDKNVGRRGQNFLASEFARMAEEASDDESE